LRIWKTTDDDFRANFAALVGGLAEGIRRAGGGPREDAGRMVRRIRRVIDDVRERGDAALIEYTERFDGCLLEPARLRVGQAELDAACDRVPPELLDALQLAAERIRAFQRATLSSEPPPVRLGGRTLRVRYRPVDSAGICIPGGSASLASTVLMTAIPAAVAGVGRIAMVTPPRRDGTVSDDRLAAAHVAGVREVYRVGGAHGVAALAFGTESVPKVDFIAGPGGPYTVLAKRLLYGQVGIEMLPGPSEVVVIADWTASADSIAADLISQAEHNPGSALLLTDDAELAVRVREAVAAQLEELPDAGAAGFCLEHYGAVVVARSLEECVELTNEIAPEHLEVIAEDPEAVASQVRHAGAIFLGPWSPVAVGDYLAGPSHVLPTGTTARFSSGLSANDFRKRTSLIEYDRRSLAQDAAALELLAETEGLPGHARSVRKRLGGEAPDAGT